MSLFSYIKYQLLEVGFFTRRDARGEEEEKRVCHVTQGSQGWGWGLKFLPRDDARLPSPRYY